MSQTIAPETTIGEIQLYVSNQANALKFYTATLGFQLLGQEGEQAFLGAGERRLVVLNEKPDAKRVKRVTGLYHFAVLLPDRRALAQLIYHLAESGTEVQGVADHGVSEAIYLADPDGNGIEVYRDRRRGEWPVDDIGKMQMGTEDLDLDDLLLELKEGVEPWFMPTGTTIGHVHLHVRDLAEAEQFYTGVLGFEVMQRYGSGASFVSAGGYHHHIGMNTWAGAGAPPPPPDAVGLRWFEVRLPTPAALADVRSRIEAAGVQVSEQDSGLLVRDPSQNGILFTAG